MKNHTTHTDLRGDLDSMSAEELRRVLFNRDYNRFIADNCDDDEHAVAGGKSIPYIGWFWRSCDFYNLMIPIGYCGFIGVIENNKWGYDERYMTKDEAETFLSYIDRAWAAVDHGGVVSEMDANKWKAIRELWDWMQTLSIHGNPASNPEVCGPAPLSPTAEQATVAGSVSTALMGGLNAEVSHE